MIRDHDPTKGRIAFYLLDLFAPQVPAGREAQGGGHAHGRAGERGVEAVGGEAV